MNENIFYKSYRCNSILIGNIKMEEELVADNLREQLCVGKICRIYRSYAQFPHEEIRKAEFPFLRNVDRGRVEIMGSLENLKFVGMSVEEYFLFLPQPVPGIITMLSISGREYESAVDTHHFMFGIARDFSDVTIYTFVGTAPKGIFDKILTNFCTVRFMGIGSGSGLLTKGAL